MRLLTSDEACRAAGVSFRQLDYWTRTHAIWPTVAAAGLGSRRGWSPDDVERLRFINAGVVAFDTQLRKPWLGKVWTYLAEEGLPDRWLLVGVDGGEWAVSVDDGEPDRSGLLIARKPLSGDGDAR